MKKIYFLLTLLLLAIGTNMAKADDMSLALGNYDEIGEYDCDDSQMYQGSWWMIAPTQYQTKHTGSQIIYTKDQLKDMAGKEIKSISFKYYNLAAFSAYPRTINVWVKEIDDNAFAYNDAKKAYCYFEYSDATKAATDFTFEEDFVDYYNMNGDLKVDFDKPFAYSGTKNLLVTITFDGDETTDTSTDIEFYYNTDDKNLAMTTCSDKSTFAEFNESEDWPYANDRGSSISHAKELKQPLTKFTYQESSAPIVEPAKFSGTVKCGEKAVENATVTLTSGETILNGNSDAEGKFSIDIDKDLIGKEFSLSAKAEGYDDYTATATMTFASGEDKTQDIELVKTILPAKLTGSVKCGEKAVENATVTLTSGETIFNGNSDAEGKFSIDIDKELIGKEFSLSAKAEGYEDYTAKSTMTFASGEDKTQDISLTKKDVPSIMTGKVTCENEAVEGAIVKLTATNDKYLTYKATTGADGSYVIRVVKSENTYTLEVTDGECEDYKEENIAFTPGQDLTKDIQLTKIPEPENSLTLGRYNKLLNNGTEDDVYYGHGYSWAAAPTNLSHKNTGSQIIYTKEQLEKLNGKAISKINFIFHNEAAYEAYPRTVRVWVKEIDNGAFNYDDKAGAYKFYDYDDATLAINDYAYDGEMYDYFGENGELELTFDKPVNYNGKNLLLTITFEGENCCNTSDFNFFCNNDVKNKAMTYFNDNYTFGEFAETEDWPYVSSDCVPALEQPVTRFFYTDATTGFNSVSSASKAAADNDKAYNLAGQRVGNGYKGIVIVNGKKFMK